MKRQELEEKKHKRELEISRALADLLDVLPAGALQAIMRGLYGLSSNLNEDLMKGYIIDHEVQLLPDSRDDARRLDVLVPLGLGPYAELIFETKLGEENLNQVNGYALARRSALVVSLARRIKDAGAHREPNVVSITWSEFFWGLVKLLGVDARKRIVDGKENPSFIFQPEFPRRSIGPIAEEYVERMLHDLRRQNLVQLAPGERVLVATGQFATRTTTEYNLTSYGPSWDDTVDYLCIVHRRKLVYVGRVIHRFREVKLGRNGVLNRTDFPDMTDQIARNIAVAWAGHRQANLLHMEEVDLASDPRWQGIALGAVFPGKVAFVMSHRYFDDIASFLQKFRGNEVEQ